MVYLRLTADSAYDADDIDTDRGFRVVRLYIVVNGRLKAEALFVVDGLFRISKQSVAPSLYFYDDEGLLIPGDNVEVVMSRLPVALQNLIALFFQELGCEILAPFP